jgi:hypothetical protein
MGAGSVMAWGSAIGATCASIGAVIVQMTAHPSSEWTKVIA